MSAVFVAPLGLVQTVIDTCHVAVGLTTGVSPKCNLIIVISYSIWTEIKCCFHFVVLYLFLI